VTDVYDTQKAHLDRYYVDAMKETQRKFKLYFIFPQFQKFIIDFFLFLDIRNYLQEESNTLPRVGAIAVGSLAGVVLGVRGGFFKKLFYASVTGSGVASVCYPREAKKYATVAYNFAHGIKAGDDERQKDLPKFPTTFGEFKDNVVSLYSSVYDTVTGKK
jgi:Apolipoprotein O